MQSVMQISSNNVDELKDGRFIHFYGNTIVQSNRFGLISNYLCGDKHSEVREINKIFIQVHIPPINPTGNG